MTAPAHPRWCAAHLCSADRPGGSHCSLPTTTFSGSGQAAVDPVEAFEPGAAVSAEEWQLAAYLTQQPGEPVWMNLHLTTGVPVGDDRVSDDEYLARLRHRVLQLTLPEAGRVGRSLSVLVDAAKAAQTVEHITSMRQLPGGPVEVRCSCGKWGGTAPSVEVAERDAAKHRAEVAR